MLGFCYDELRQYEQAYYYLTFTLGLNRSVYAEEYVNCMVSMGDFRSLGCIDGLLNELRGSLPEDEEEEIDPSLRSFLRFLYRRKAYVLVEMRRLDEAEKLLRRMVSDPDSSDFALGELAYIRHLREGRQTDREGGRKDK